MDDSGGDGSFSAALESSRKAFASAITRIAPVDEGFEQLIDGIVAPILSQVSHAHHDDVRERLRSQAVAFDIKLAQARSAGKLALANQAAQLEFEVNEKFEKMVAASQGESSHLVEQAHREAEAAKAELHAIKMKLEGVQASRA